MTMKNISLGLLPLYLELYDNISNDKPDIRIRLTRFIKTIESEFRKRDTVVFTAPICRIESEFKSAVTFFEHNQVDAIVTLHLAYSPSLESIQALTGTYLPIIVLDTTETFGFGPEQSPSEIMFNHGIHGVQDLCNMLIRKNKLFQIVTGHWEKSDVIDRTIGCIRSAKLAANIKQARVGIIGKEFIGMGDFSVPVDVMRNTIGIETIPFNYSMMKSYLPNSNDEHVLLEIENDRKAFIIEDVDHDSHIRTTRTSLALRKWIDNENLSAFTFNFLDINRESGLLTVPFLEASKEMARGIGYAGEGDVLTAALVGALATVYCETTFTEMFCPDWENDSIFLSHMGEMNIQLVSEKPILKEMDFIYTDTDNPLTAYARLKSGKAVLVDLAPGPDYTYSLIVSPVMMLDVSGHDNMSGNIHGWMKHSLGTAKFLEMYSKAGGTHHAALVYGDVAHEIEQFGRLMGWKVVHI